MWIDVVDETAGRIELHLPVTIAVAGAGEDAMPLSARDGHIEQAALLFQFPFRAGGQGAWENVLLQADDKHRGELQSLGTVHGHERHAMRIVALLAVEVGQQRHFLQETGQRHTVGTVLFPTRLHELLHTAKEFFQVLLPRQGFGRLLAVEVFVDAALLNDARTDGVGIFRLSQSDKLTDQVTELQEPGGCPLVHVQAVLDGVAHNAPQAHPVIHGCLSHFLHRRIADSTGGIVDDAPDGLLVVGVDNDAEIGNDVLDFLALVEAEAAVDAIRDVLLAEGLLEATALGVGAVENGEVAILALVLTADALDVLAHDDGLLLVAIGLLQDQLLALGVAAEYVLRNLPLVVLDQAVGRLYNALRAAVVALQLELTGIVVNLRELQDVVDVRSTKSVDALGIVAHHTHRLPFLGQLIDDSLLSAVRVLILIDKNVSKLVDILPANVLVLVEQHVGIDQQVVEVHRIRLPAAGYIGRVDMGDVGHALLEVALQQTAVVGIVVGQYQVVLRHTDAVVHRSGLIDLVVQFHVLDKRLDERL